MTLEQQIAAIRAWQMNGNVHPLLCRVDFRHRPLIASLNDGAVVLACPDCEYVQRFIPPAVFRLPLAGV